MMMSFQGCWSLCAGLVVDPQFVRELGTGEGGVH